MSISPLHQAARTHALAGIPVFPCVEGGKEPATASGFKDASCDLAQIDSWWSENPNYNVAIAPEGAGLCVVDVDPPDGENSLFEIELDNGALPKTYEVQTPRDGRHLYFKGSLPPSANKLGPNIDTRGRGSYVLVPPSRTMDGVYKVADDSDYADCPSWIVETLSAKREHATATVHDLDLPINISRAKSLLKHYAETGDVAVEGQGGDARTYQLCAEVLNLGVAEETALDLIDRHWNVHCVPPWPLDELTSKLENAARYAQNEPGAYAAPSTSQAFPANDPALDKLIAESRDVEGERSTGLPWSSFGEVLSRTVPPLREIVPGLLERGTVTFLSGVGGSNKSRLGLQLGLSICNDALIFGRSVERSHFVYLSYEDHPDEVARRAQAIARRLELPTAGAAEYLDLSGKDAPLATISEIDGISLCPLWNELHAHLKSIDGHKFILIDSTYNAVRFVGSAKINEGAVMAGIGLLQRLCDETDSTILALWHPSQAGQERGDASGWSVAWHNAPRARLSITAVKDAEGTYELKVEKRNHGPKGKPITLHWSEGVLLPRTETAIAENETAFLTSVIRVAIEAAESGSPIQKQRRLERWQLDWVEKAVGRRPSDREVKDALAAALPAGQLRYVGGSQHRTAGYYPADQDRAYELAHLAKRGDAKDAGHE
jgi:hypothetical protein